MTKMPQIDARTTTEADEEQLSTKPPRLLRLPEVMNRVGLRRSTIYQRMNEGRFPRCRSLGPKSSVWVEAEIDAWVESVINAGSKTK